MFTRFLKASILLRPNMQKLGLPSELVYLVYAYCFSVPFDLVFVQDL